MRRIPATALHSQGPDVYMRPEKSTLIKAQGRTRLRIYLTKLHVGGTGQGAGACQGAKAQHNRMTTHANEMKLFLARICTDRSTWPGTAQVHARLAAGLC